MISNAKVGQYWETWNTFKCPKCDKLNWICMGNLDDLSAWEPEAGICYNCKTKFWLSSITKSDYELTNEDCCNEELGLKKDEDLIESVISVKGSPKP